MNSAFTDFQDKRMDIFKEIVKQSWNALQSIDLNKLEDRIKAKYGFNDEDRPFIRDHIRLAMGLNTRGDVEFSDEVDLTKNLKSVDGPIIAKINGACQYCDENIEDNECYESCLYEAHIYRRSEGPVIENNKCLSCGQCVSSCSFGAIADKIEFVPLIDILKNKEEKVFAAAAPSIAGQFGDNISLGQLRTALKLIGFEDMVEVALFADILTIKEAYEFNHLVKSENDFFITSCCCPVWVNMVEKHYHKLMDSMVPSISPMVAAGRILKILYPGSKVVFIGPCIAKKAEAKEDKFKEDIDFVLTYRELREVFNALEIRLEDLPGDDKDQASYGGRVYARTGGVSFSVKTAVNRIAPRRLIKFNPKRVDGVTECKHILDELTSQKVNANFIEGMGCKGGCVGGPRTNIDVEKGTKIANDVGEDSLIMTPFDNVNVTKILTGLGLHNLDNILEDKNISKILARQKYEIHKNNKL
ncbi:[Fe-Fe] hydrogenase large subunit C-terminal domain-containing protein [Brassicibacter mesophilus]|uniref:[Fe-Fe] hydrogenase large subunit C-terminal domain-containing protein n=1 Tax=Brassicibacter mesophilus TaxID=745119 RepID=UPI003D1AC971